MKQPIYQILDIPFPETTDAERLVLADAVSNQDMMGDLVSLIHPDFFTSSDRRTIWETMVDDYNHGRPFDIVTLPAKVGPIYKKEILPQIENAGFGDDVLEHTAILRTGNARRRAYFAATAFLQKSIEPSSTEQDILSGVEIFTKTVEGPAPLQNEIPLASGIAGVREDVKKMEELKKEGKKLRISTGFDYMDQVLNGGFKPGQLIILAARPSVGKTAVMLQMAKTAALAGSPVYICSLEMTCPELCERLLFSTGKIRPFQITSADMDWQAFAEAEGELAPLPLYINDFSRTTSDLVNRITQAAKSGRCKIAFIDYLGLIAEALSVGGNIKLYQVIANITGTMKNLAKRLGIPIVLLCQQNRDQVREKRSPELYDLRDSGSIEQDADIVLMLEPQPAQERIIAWLRKHRSGKRDIGFVLKPNNTYSAFTEELPLGQAEPVKQPEPEALQGSINFHGEDDDDDNDLPF